uniref:non-specific serine/threonine protein kinase n=1 Tax=Chlamydomonas reinhardtii TaxID=3055 RepID=Q6UPR3_CHLRE|nr:NIMA-related kinase 3 [Chlamydomonas reinhardtii]
MALQWGSFANAGIKELVAGADPTLNIKEGTLGDRYELQREIGSGSYGQAVLATRLEDGMQVVCKQIRLFEMDDKARADTLTEAKVLAQFNHVNIVHYYECVLESGVLNIVMEYANGGDLAAAIQRRQAEKKPYSEDEIMFWFVQIVLALYHVHGRNVLHRDLKSQNIFIAEGNLLKLGDFGIARVLNSDTELARTVIGSPYYLSPEICEDRPYNRKSDVWSLGCVLYELATLRRAFDGQSLPALVVKILRGKYPPVPTRYSTPLRGLIESMLKQNPKDRPSADAILKSDFVRQHVERYAAHVMALGVGAGGEALGEGEDGAAAAAAALGLAELVAANVRPKPSPPSRATRPGAARPPRAPSTAGALTPASSGAPVSPAPGGSGGDMERGSSREVSEAETGVSTPADGSSPNKPPAAPAGGRRAAGQKLVESGWVRQQQDKLAELAGALAAQKAGGVGAEAAAGAMDATLPSAAVGGGGVSQNTAAKAKLAELKLQRDAELEAQRKANAAGEQKAAAAARRNHEEAVAVRGRAAARQKDIERNLAEQKAEMAAKARKAAALAVAIKQREEARKRELDEAAQHMSAHKEQVKAARARINKEQLSELGAQFAARLASGGGASGAGETSSGQVLVVDFTADQPSSSTPVSKASPAHLRHRSPAHGAPVAGRQSPTPAAKAPRARAAAAAGSDSEGAGPSGRGAQKPAADPPWKLRHKPKGEFPEVQIFTPFGSGAVGSAADTAAAESDAGAGNTEEDDEAGQQAAGVLEVLAQIHTVLEGDDDEGGGGHASARPSSAATADEDEGGTGRPGGAAQAAANALKVEQLRIDLEGQLGGAAFLAAYRCLRDMQAAEEADGEGAPGSSTGGGSGGGAAAGGVGVGGGGTQRELERILGPKLHLVRQVHKLITLEDAVFA